MQALGDQVEIIVPEEGLAKKLGKNRPLRVKLGFDPTAPDLHLGHAVALKKLRAFQQAGHNVTVIIGDYTARIGDPTGRNAMRPPLSAEQIADNARTYVAQLAKILDVTKIDIRFNSEWFARLSFEETLRLLSRMTVAQMMQRNDFSERYAKGVPIGLHELVYPVMQGYDSVVIEADIEIGGTDQLFNCLVGKALQESLGKEPQIVLCMSLLRGLDGKEKMSKSKGNYIGLTESPDDMFGKLMSIPDALLPEYIALATDFSSEEKQMMQQALLQDGANPMEAKKKMALDVVTQYHDARAAEAAEARFRAVVQRKQVGAEEYRDFDAGTLALPVEKLTLLDICHAALGGAQTRSGLRRLFEGGGVSVNQEKITDPMKPASSFADTFELKIGKREFVRVHWKTP